MTSLDPYKSPNDKKSYYYTTLESGLECIIVSNTANIGRQISSAAITVEVGSFADPPEALGLAHFLEHMVFMGSAKYPGENEYDSFVSSHGGGCNAFTEGEYTTYQFDVTTKHYSKALDIFANCFLTPLFNEGSVRREILSIESEFKLAKNSDSNRLQQIQCLGFKQGHAAGKFGWGNMYSLDTKTKAEGTDIMKLLREFHKKYYHTSRMKLVLTSPEPIDTLRTYLVASFGPEESSCTTVTPPPPPPPPPLSYGVSSEQLPIENDTFKILTYVNSVRKSHKLYLTWQFPSMVGDYRCKSASYLAHLIGHEGPASLLSSLKEKGYVIGLTAGVGTAESFTNNSMYSLFTMSVILTDRGLSNWVIVADMIFKFIALLQNKGVQEWIFEELKQVAAIDYRYLEEDDESDFVEGISINMASVFAVDRKDILSCDIVLEKFDPDAVRNILSHMTPDKARVDLLSPLFVRKLKDGEVDDTVWEDVDEEDEEDYDSGNEDDDEDVDEEGDDDEDDDDEDDGDEEDDEEYVPISHEEFNALYEGPAESSIKSLCNLQVLETDSKEEEYFGTVYWQAPLPTDLYTYWKSQESVYTFDIPPRNEYIPTNLALETPMESTLDKNDPDAFKPLLVVNEHNGGLRLWHCLDLRFAIPKVVITTRIASMRTQDSAQNAALTGLLVRLARDALQEEQYMASMASLDLHLSATDVSIDLCVAGYSEKANHLYEVGFKAFYEACRDMGDTKLFAEDIIRRQYEQLLKDLRNVGLSASSSAKNARLCALKLDRYSSEEQLNALLALNIEDDYSKLRSLLQQYLASFLSEVYIEGLCQGNCTVTSVEQLSSKIITMVQGVSKMSKIYCPLQPILKVPTSQKHIILNVAPKNPNEENCAVEVYYQLGTFSMESLLMLYLLEQLLYELFYELLRTKMQIGYSVNLGIRETYGILGFCFQVTSASHSTEEIRRGIYIFVESIPDILAGMSLYKGDQGHAQRMMNIRGKERDNKHAEKLILLDALTAFVDNKLMPYSTLSDACKVNWSEIEERRYCFNKNYSQAIMLISKLCNACWDDMGTNPVGWTDDISNEKLEILLSDLVKMSETLFIDKDTTRLMIIQSRLKNFKASKLVKVDKKAKKDSNFDIKKAITITNPRQARNHCEKYESVI